MQHLQKPCTLTVILVLMQLNLYYGVMAISVELLLRNLPFPRIIKLQEKYGLNNIFIGQKSNGIISSGVMKPGLLLGLIDVSLSLGNLVKSFIPTVLRRRLESLKDGCSGHALAVSLRGHISFGRRNGDQ